MASYESVRAISAALEIPIGNLRREGASLVRTPLARWLGAAAALALVVGSSGFFLLKDYQKVRVLRTVEQWVTAAQPSTDAAHPTP